MKEGSNRLVKSKSRFFLRPSDEQKDIDKRPKYDVSDMGIPTEWRNHVRAGQISDRIELIASVV